MLPDRVSNPGPLTYESGALPIALCGPSNCASINATVADPKLHIREGIEDNSKIIFLISK